ncbi:MAG TPA: ATP-dependent helicase HrpB [Alphaproteobacteria bacterium]|nr:ATP-dependent helicase HrpB [Alphaproteobacteria bacterium]
MTSLPIDPLLPKIAQQLCERNAVVLVAPPGAGKTTRVPLALLSEPWLANTGILLLEPRRLAARAAAARMAAILGERVGGTVGYRIRLERRVSGRTRIEVVTEGILTRRLQDDPALKGVGLIIFDEFHERSLDADLGLAIAIDIQRNLRPELRILAMSATLDGSAVSRILGGAPIVESQGREFPIETRYLEGALREPATSAAAKAVKQALGETEGDILVFLPGEREIRAVERSLRSAGLAPRTFVAPLYGALAQEAQDKAIYPSPPGRRKIVLATSIAETSLTIEGVRTVIDAGLSRVPRFDPVTGLSRLETIRVSRASAEQRRGRAGRLGPGLCYRLWPEAETRGLMPLTRPEILDADLASLALELALWGVEDAQALAWLDPPPQKTLAEARDLLRRLDALETNGRVSEHGRAMARLPMHPRLAHMVLRAKERGLGQEAASLAALLAERDILSGPGGSRDADLRTRLELFGNSKMRHRLPPSYELRQGALKRAIDAARQTRRMLEIEDRSLAPARAGVLVALAYPDRIAGRRPQGGFRLANGRGAALAEEDPLGNEPWLAVAEVSGTNPDGRIFLACPIQLDEIEAEFGTHIESSVEVAWDPRSQFVLARRRRRLAALILADAPWNDAPDEAVAAAMLDGVRALGLSALPWTPAARSLQARIEFLRSLEGDASTWPDLSDADLERSLGDWLGPYLGGVRNVAGLQQLDLAHILSSRLDHRQRQRLHSEAPVSLCVPSGRTLPLDYSAPDGPVLAVKLQEMFGLADTPRVANGRVPVLLHLLSPAGRPMQVTRDLASFWRTGYADVKRDLKGRYPKHPWPDDPARATPTAGVQRRTR